MRRLRVEPGVTLVELIATLAILGVLAGVVGLAAGRAAMVPSVDEPTARIAAARREALRTRRPVQITISIAGAAYSATALPDGRVIADPPLAIDRLTGRPDVAR